MRLNEHLFMVLLLCLAERGSSSPIHEPPQGQSDFQPINNQTSTSSTNIGSSFNDLRSPKSQLSSGDECRPVPPMLEMFLNYIKVEDNLTLTSSSQGLVECKVYSNYANLSVTVKSLNHGDTSSQDVVQVDECMQTVTASFMFGLDPEEYETFWCEAMYDWSITVLGNTSIIVGWEKGRRDELWSLIIIPILLLGAGLLVYKYRNRIFKCHPRSSQYESVQNDVPSAPTQMEVTMRSGLVLVTWEAPADNGGTEITGYVLERRKGRHASWKLAGNVDGFVRSFEDESFDGKDSIAYRMKAINAKKKKVPTATLR